MPIKQENLITLTGDYIPGQRFVMIDGTLVPVGFGTPYIPGSTVIKPSATGVYYKCASVDTDSSKWTGYKATQLDDGTWSFAEEVTTDLSFTEITPEVDSIYSYDALVRVKLWTGSISCKYLRFQIRATKLDDPDAVQMSEFKLIDNSDAEVSLSSLGTVTVTASPNTTSSSESLTNLIDDNANTKWCNTAYTPPTNVYFEFSEPVDDLLSVYKGYCWYTANDGSYRDPVSWTIFVSEDGSTWEQIAKVENASITEDRSALAGTWEWNM